MLSWLVIAPPLLVLALILTTRRMIMSFFIGIIASALIATDGNIMATGYLVVQRLLNSAGIAQLATQPLVNNWNLCIFIFLLCLGGIISLLSESGAASAYTHVVQRFVTSRVSAQIASLILSCFFFIDDYFSVLTVGSVMRPLTQRYGVPPVKLAFLTTAMASPLTILSPVSSWIGEIIVQLKQSGINDAPNNVSIIIFADPFYVFFRCIPFILYALFIIIAVWYIVVRRISYGPMAIFERNFHPISDWRDQKQSKNNSSFFDFIFPIMILIGTVFAVLAITGSYWLFGGTNSFLETMKQASVQQALLAGGIIGLSISLVYFLITKKITLNQAALCIKNGIGFMLPSIIMLIHVWALGALLKQDLNTGGYLAQLTASIMHITFFPMLCFIIAGGIAWMIGSAWATIGLMFPIVLDMLKTLLVLPPHTSLDVVPLLMPILGATLSGCIIGTHLSLLADNPIMSAASTGANHVDHVKTMAWYVIPVALATASAYGIIGITINNLGLFSSLCLAYMVGIIALVLLLEVGQRLFGYKK